MGNFPKRLPASAVSGRQANLSAGRPQPPVCGRRASFQLRASSAWRPWTKLGRATPAIWSKVRASEVCSFIRDEMVHDNRRAGNGRAEPSRNRVVPATSAVLANHDGADDQLPVQRALPWLVVVECSTAHAMSERPGGDVVTNSTLCRVLARSLFGVLSEQ